MKELIYCKVLLLVLFCPLFLGCSKHATLPTSPDVGVPESEMNKRITVEAPEGWNTFKIGQVVSLNVKVISEEQIEFKSNYGAKVFMLKDDKWTEIRNLMEYPQGTVLLSPSKGDPFKEGNATIDPIIPDKNNTVTLRIFLIGNILEGGKVTDKQTAGFVDLTLKP